MTPILLFALFIILIVSLGVYKGNWTNPVFLFVGIWTVISFFSCLGLFGLYEISDRTYFYVFVGCFSFAIGAYVAQKFTIKNKRKTVEQKYNVVKEHKLSKLFFATLTIAIFFWIVGIAPKIVMYMNGISISEMRYGEISVVGYGDDLGFWLGIINSYISYPFINASICLLNCKGIIENKMIHIYLSLALVLLLILGVGAREIIAYSFVELFLCTMIIRKKRNPMKNKKKRKKIGIKIIVPISICIIIFIGISMGRGMDLYGIIRGIYVYACASLVLFEYTLEHSASYYVDHTFGSVSIMGFTRLIYNTLAQFGVQIPSVFMEGEDFQLKLQYTLVHTSSESKGYFNYFGTCFSYFIKDFGFWGLIIVPIVYGFISGKVYKKLQGDIWDYRFMALYLFLCSGYVMSIADFQFITIKNAMPIVYIILLTGSKRFLMPYEDKLRMENANKRREA